jgi:leucyl-tRNA synthetase
MEKVTTKMHQTIKKCTKDMQDFRYNTAISASMEYVNLLREVAEKSEKGESKDWRQALSTLTLLLAPFAPHMTEEMWVEKLGKDFSVHKVSWPVFNKAKMSEDKVTIAIQVNGKLRGVLEVDKAMAEKEDELVNLAKSEANISKWLKGDPKKTIFVPGKIINFVI